jgi:hypothetical protein
MRYKNRNAISTPFILSRMLDDDADPVMISKNDHPIIKFLNIFGYIHISYAICVQTLEESIKKLRRLIDDMLYIDIFLMMT